MLNVGLNWSPDEAYIIGRSQLTTNTGMLRIVRTSDGTDVILRLKNATDGLEDYIEPDWRSLKTNDSPVHQFCFNAGWRLPGVRVPSAPLPA